MLASTRSLGRCPLPLRRATTLASRSSQDGQRLQEKLREHIKSFTARRPLAKDVHADVFVTSVNQIKRSLRDKNFSLLQSAWDTLKERDLLSFLGPNHVNGFAPFVLEIYRTVNPELLGDHLELIHEVALYAALNRSTDPLYECLLTLLKQRRPEKVLRLYSRFTQQLSSRETPLEEEASEVNTNSEDPDGVFSIRTSDTHIPRRVDILLTAVAAHAMLNQFKEAFSLCSGASARFQRAPVERFLNALDFDSELKKRVEFYADRLRTASYLVKSTSLAKHIDNLAVQQNSNALLDIYSSIIRGIKEEAYIASEPSKTSEARPVAMDDQAWSAFLTAFMKIGRKDLASQLWEDLGTLDISPSTFLWTAAINAYNTAKYPNEAVAVWELMQRSSVHLDGLAYRAAIAALFNSNRVHEAMACYTTFDRSLRPSSPAEHILAVHNTLLQGLLALKKYDQADVLLRTMRSEGPPPDLVTFNTLLGHYGRRQDFKALARVMEEMISAKVVGDVFSFSTILTAMLKSGREDAPDLMMELMRSQGVEPNAATYTSIISSQVRMDEERHFVAALRILSSMENDPALHPNHVTYYVVLDGLLCSKSLTDEAKLAHKAHVLNCMKKKAIKLTPQLYHVLIKGCVASDSPAATMELKGHYDEMKRNKVVIMQDTWYLFLSGMAHKGEWDMADRMVRDVLMKYPNLRSSLKELVSRIRRRESRPVYITDRFSRRMQR